MAIRLVEAGETPADSVTATQEKLWEEGWGEQFEPDQTALFAEPSNDPDRWTLWLLTAPGAPVRVAGELIVESSAALIQGEEPPLTTVVAGRIESFDNNQSFHVVALLADWSLVPNLPLGEFGGFYGLAVLGLFDSSDAALVAASELRPTMAPNPEETDPLLDPEVCPVFNNCRLAYRHDETACIELLGAGVLNCGAGLVVCLAACAATGAAPICPAACLLAEAACLLNNQIHFDACLERAKGDYLRCEAGDPHPHPYPW